MFILTGEGREKAEKAELGAQCKQGSKNPWKSIPIPPFFPVSLQNHLFLIPAPEFPPETAEIWGGKCLCSELGLELLFPNVSPSPGGEDGTDSMETPNSMETPDSLGILCSPCPAGGISMVPSFRKHSGASRAAPGRSRRSWEHGNCG